MSRAGAQKTSAKTAPRSISGQSRARGRARPSDTAHAGDAAAVWVAPSELRPWAKNPRRNEHAVAAVAASIEEFDFGAPIVARLANNEIIKGHTRWLAANRLKLKLVPVRFLDISETKAHKLALADNKLGELSDWDDALVAEQLMALDGGDRELLGWGEDEFNDLLGDEPALLDPEKPKRKPRSKRCPACNHEW